MLRFVHSTYYVFVAWVIGMVMVFPILAVSGIPTALASDLPKEGFWLVVDVLLQLLQAAVWIWVVVRYAAPMTARFWGLYTQLMRSNLPVSSSGAFVIIGNQFAVLWRDVCWLARRFHA
jgi:hypothetical protein